MTDIQLPFNSHQKAMNGKYSPKNLEIRGFAGGGVSGSVGGGPNGTQLSNDAKIPNSAPKKSFKIIDKTPTASFQVLRYKLEEIPEEAKNILIWQKQKRDRLHPNQDFSTFVSVFDINPNISKTRSRSSKLDNADSIEQRSQIGHQSSNQQIHHNHHQHHHPSVHNIIWNDESNAGWTSTGVMSDRSSVYSIDDGDFDKEASRKVNNQLREIESVLYEQTTSHNSNQNECKEWLEKFPHLRILGKQIYPRDEYLSETIRSSAPNSQANLRNLAQSNSASNLSAIHENNQEKLSGNTNLPPTFSNYKFFRRRDQNDLSNNQNLQLNGVKMNVVKFSDAEVLSKPEEFVGLEEELIEQDGTYEELLAYDNQEEEYLSEQNKRLNLNKRRRHGIPPITPKASMKDLVVNFLFDHMWSELIDWSAETIKTYAKSISDEFVSDSASTTPRLIGNIEDDLELKETNQPPKENTLPPINLNQFNTNNETQTSISNNSANISNTSQVANTFGLSALSTTVTRANIIHLKLFDSSANTNFYSLLEKPSAPMPNLLTRENSLFNSKLLSGGVVEASGGSDTVGDLIKTKEYLQIKQLNKNGASVKNLSANSRVGSGTRRQNQLNVLKKRNSSIEVGSSQSDKNMTVQGAALGKPTSLTQIGDNLSEKSFFPLGNLSNSNPTSVLNNRSTSAHTPHHHHHQHSSHHQQQHINSLDNDTNLYENDLTELGNHFNSDNGENKIDEINIINSSNRAQSNTGYINNSSSSSNNRDSSNHAYYNHGHFNYFGHNYHNHPGYVNNQHQLPPIENSLISKPLRISSASNAKQIKEKSDRPLTSTATRFDSNGIPSLNKRSTTPSGVNRGIFINNKKLNRLSADDSIYSNNYLSAKSYNNATLANSPGSNNSLIVQSVQNNSASINRRNSIKDLHASTTRVYR